MNNYDLIFISNRKLTLISLSSMFLRRLKKMEVSIGFIISLKRSLIRNISLHWINFSDKKVQNVTPCINSNF
jgi:hypothetical protein